MSMFNLKSPIMMLWAVVLLITLTGCPKDEPKPESKKDAIASFVATVVDNAKREVKFTNASQNATSYKWDFGDGTSSTEKDPPNKTYSEFKTYKITLTATGESGKASVKENSVTLTEPASADALTKVLRRTWKLQRTAASVGVYAKDFSTTHWEIPADAVPKRPCLYDNEFIFSADGSFEFKSNGTAWLEASIEEKCISEADLSTIKKAKDGTDIDISSWKSGKHTYKLNIESKDGYIGTLTLNGKGAFLGLPKASGDGSKESDPQPFANSTTYSVKRLVDGKDKPDSLEVHYIYGSNVWVMRLVSYKNAGQEPPLGNAKPAASFTTEVDKSNTKLVKFANKSTFAVKYEWNFGDGSDKRTVTNKDEISHTYAKDGIYDVVLVAFNSDNETDTAKAKVTAGIVCTAETAEDTTSLASFNLTFKTKTSRFVFGGFGGVTTARISNPVLKGMNMSCWVHEYKRASDAQDWGGSGMNLLTLLNDSINFSTLSKKGIKMKVYSSKANTKVQIRLEKFPHPNVNPFLERNITMTKTDEWEEITFNFSDDVSGNKYRNFLIYFDKGTTGSAATYYFDDVQFVDVAAIAPKPVAKFSSAPDASNNKLIKFTNTSTNAVKYEWNFGDGSAKMTVNNKNEISHTYAKDGTYDVALVAFNADNKTDTAKAKVTVGAAAPPGDRVLETFEGAAPTFSAFNGANPSVVNNTFKGGINTSDKIMQLINPANGAPDGGTVIAFSTGLDWSKGKVITFKARVPREGKVIKLKVEGPSGGVPAKEVDLTTRVGQAGNWVEFRADFTGVDPRATKFVIFADFLTSGTKGADTYFFDDFKQVTKIPDRVLETFEGAAPTFGVFNGAVVSVDNNPASGGINTSAKVMKFVNADNGRADAGTTLTPTTALDWSKGKTIRFKAYVPAAGKVIKLKFEGGGAPAKEVDITTQADQVNKWVELSADFTGIDPRVTTFVIFADFLTSGTKSASTYYFDDFKQVE